MAPHRDIAAWCEDRGRSRAPSVIPTRHGPVFYDRNDFDLGVALAVANIEDRISGPSPDGGGTPRLPATGSVPPPTSRESTAEWMHRNDPVAYQQCRDAGRL